MVTRNLTFVYKCFPFLSWLLVVREITIGSTDLVEILKVPFSDNQVKFIPPDLIPTVLSKETAKPPFTQHLVIITNYSARAYRLNSQSKNVLNSEEGKMKIIEKCNEIKNYYFLRIQRVAACAQYLVNDVRN